MRIPNPDARRYYRRIRSFLPSVGKAKAAILAQLKQTLSDFVGQHPDARYEDIQAHYGTPEVVAASYIEAQDTSVLLRNLRLRKRVLCMIGAALAAALLLWGSAVLGAIIDFNSNKNNYLESYIIEIK